MTTLSTLAPPCDCCGGTDWVHLFTLSGRDLGRCADCGLHYIAQMPAAEQRMTEIEAGHFGETRGTDSRTWLRGEQARRAEFDGYVAAAARFAPAGRWLDVGCGAGILIQVAAERGIVVDGLELDPDRRQIAARSGATVHGRPIEDLGLPAESYAAVTMVNVFSHVIGPTSTLAEVRRVLLPGGVVLLRTGEIGPGRVRPRHNRNWHLGDHLSFLGDRTIERYAEKTGMDLVHRERDWLPAEAWTRQRMLLPGPSRARNAVKTALRVTPGALRMARWYATHRREADSPCFSSTLILRKPSGW
jgi:2-polyprenyl-3-methyl-5-hydroxy-6-metoxy-1,4-benzoquinol methylase